MHLRSKLMFGRDGQKVGGQSRFTSPDEEVLAQERKIGEDGNERI